MASGPERRAVKLGGAVFTGYSLEGHLGQCWNSGYAPCPSAGCVHRQSGGGLASIAEPPSSPAAVPLETQVLVILSPEPN